jgi:hypothetical protein
MIKSSIREIRFTLSPLIILIQVLPCLNMNFALQIMTRLGTISDSTLTSFQIQKISRLCRNQNNLFVPKELKNESIFSIARRS